MYIRTCLNKLQSRNFDYILQTNLITLLVGKFSIIVPLWIYSNSKQERRRRVTEGGDGGGPVDGRLGPLG